MNWYLEVLKKYAVFNGRARRKEYWMFFLLSIGIALALSFVERILHTVVLTTLYQLAVLVPSVAVGVRRMHDTDHSGWWFLFPIVNLVFAVQEGQPGGNRFGPDPKAVLNQSKQARSQHADKEETGKTPAAIIASGRELGKTQLAEIENADKKLSPAIASAMEHISQATSPFSIPAIIPEHVSLSLVDSTQLGKAGPGGDSFQEAIQHMNSRDDAAAIRSFQEALAESLDPLRQGYAHANLGEIYIRANDIENALNEFTIVLNCKEALFESVHSAALYLSIVYRELGKPEAVNILEQLKYKTSGKINTSLSPETAARVRQLAINNKSRLLSLLEQTL